MLTRLIDPLVDCVFKAILGVQARDWMLIDFLNAVLKLPVPITAVTIKNPYSELDYESDKLTIIDILAEDALGRSIQVELQLKMHPALAERILYTWASLHKTQLNSGADFHQLKPTYSIWLMRDRLTTLDSAAAHHCFTAWDRRNNVGLTDQMEIHLIELAKWKPPASLDGESAWLYFFKEAKGWQDLPATLHSRPLEAAMTVLKQFSENEADWHRYQTRLHTQMLQATLDEEHRRIKERAAQAEQAQQQAEQAQQQAEQARQQAEAQARTEHERAERLLARLRALGLEE